jgi:hypothetical protein
MVWVVGLVDRQEMDVLASIGWEAEEPPTSWDVPDRDPEHHVKAYWVDAGVLEVMTGPDWDVADLFSHETDQPAEQLNLVGLTGHLTELYRALPKSLDVLNRLLNRYLVGDGSEPLPATVQKMAAISLLTLLRELNREVQDG